MLLFTNTAAKLCDAYLKFLPGKKASYLIGLKKCDAYLKSQPSKKHHILVACEIVMLYQPNTQAKRAAERQNIYQPLSVV